MLVGGKISRKILNLHWALAVLVIVRPTVVIHKGIDFSTGVTRVGKKGKIFDDAL